MRVKIFHDKITLTRLFYWLIILTPVIDTINGAFILQHGDTGVSIGTFYRFFIMLFIFCISIIYKIKSKYIVWILLATYFPLNCVLRGELYDLSFVASFSYGVKWFFSIILMICFLKLQEISTERICIKLLNCWCFLIPGLLIVEHILNIGEKTYWDAGFRGLYYSINDVGFSLTMMMTYSLYQLILLEVNVKHIAAVAINFVAIIILATKSCLIFTVLSTGYYLLVRYKKNTFRAMVYTFIMTFFTIIGIYTMYDKLIEMLNRYILFFSQTVIEEKNFYGIMNFLTSARTPRIAKVFDELFSDFSIFKVLFGWKPPYNGGAIEMDWFDSFFQHGILVFSILLGYCYSFFFKDRKYKTPWLYILIIAMICSFFSGHVLNGALSSTIFAVVAQCAVSSKKLGEQNKFDRCETSISYL